MEIATVENEVSTMVVAEPCLTSRSSGSAYVVCIDNTDYAASLEKHKIYRAIHDAAASAEGDIRIIDESGEDYLYPAERFLSIAVSAELEQSLAID